MKRIRLIFSIIIALSVLSCAKQDIESGDGWKGSEEYKILSGLGVDLSGFSLASTFVCNTEEDNVSVKIHFGNENGKSVAHAVLNSFTQEPPQYEYIGKLTFGNLQGRKSVNVGYGEMVEFEHKGQMSDGYGLYTNGVLYFTSMDYYQEIVENPQKFTQYREYTENPKLTIYKDNVTTNFAISPEDKGSRMAPGYNGGVILGTKAYSSDGTLLYTCDDWWASLFSYQKVFWYPITEEEFVAVCFSQLSGGKAGFSIPGMLTMRVEHLNLKSGEYIWSSTGELSKACNNAGVTLDFNDRIDSIKNIYSKDSVYKFQVKGKAYSGTDINFIIIIDVNGKSVEVTK